MFKKEDLVIKEKYFIYKGNAYTNKEDITYQKSRFLINEKDNKEYDLGYCFNDDIEEGTLLKLIYKYKVKRGFFELESFDTEEEAKHFINLITNTKSNSQE